MTATLVHTPADMLDAVSEVNRKLMKRSLTDGPERRMQRALAASFRRQGALFVASLADVRGLFPTEAPREAIGPADWHPRLDRALNETREALRRTVESALAESLVAGGRAALTTLGSSLPFDLAHPRAATFASTRAAELVTNIAETTRSYVRTLITRGIEEGWSYGKTARMLKARFTEFAVGSPLEHIRSRAELISVTENAFAYEHGNRIAIDQLTREGVATEKSWITVGDDRVDPDCSDNEAGGWIGSDAPFSDGSMMPPAHPGCRCTTGYRVVGERLPGGQLA